MANECEGMAQIFQYICTFKKTNGTIEEYFFGYLFQLNAYYMKFNSFHAL